MFKCKKCKSLEAEILHLREQNGILLDRVVALADARVYGTIHRPSQDDSEYYGYEDHVMAYDENGQRIFVTTKKDGDA